MRVYSLVCLSFKPLLFRLVDNNNSPFNVLLSSALDIAPTQTLRLSRNSSGDREPSSGHLVNLMSNDVSRFDMASVFLNWVWSAPILTLVISWILYERVGWAPLIGVGIILVVVPMQCKRVSIINGDKWIR